MKNMRYLPLIAFAILCVIAYSIYRMGSFINTTVNAKNLEKEDNLVNQTTDPSMAPSSLIFDTFPMPPTATEVQKAPVEQEPIPAETAKQPISTSLASPSVPKTATVLKEEKKIMPPSVATTTTNETLKGAGDVRFHVIVGSFSIEANAKAKALDFEAKNSQKATVIQQGGYFRVCADEFEFASSATIYTKKLKAAGIDVIILKF